MKLLKKKSAITFFQGKIRRRRKIGIRADNQDQVRKVFTQILRYLVILIRFSATEDEGQPGAALQGLVQRAKTIFYVLAKRFGQVSNYNKI
jgi:hypothetical protein